MKSLNMAALLALFCIAGCRDSLYVVNENEPDRARVVASSDGVESLIGDSYLTYWLATEQWGGPLGLTVAANELCSSWGNQGMRDLSIEPRQAFNNTMTYGSRAHVEVPWFGIYSALAHVSDGLRAILDPDDPVQIGVNGADNPRAIAFGRLVQGVSYGFLAAFFDQAYIVDETIDWEELAADPTLAPLMPYTDVMAAAIGYLQEAISVAESASPFTTPSRWINDYPMTNALLVQVAHSYIARFTAAVARRPDERAAVDWAAVKDHAIQGLASSADDFGPWGDGYKVWISDFRWIAGVQGWVRADYHTIGLADDSGNYAAWLAALPNNRYDFKITTNDLRIHGATPDTVIAPADATHAADTTITPAEKTPGTQFIYAGSNPFRHNRYPYLYSRYEPTVWKEYAKTEATQMITLTYVEMQLLIAEAEFRLGNLAASAAIVNVTRTAAGLPALDGTEDDFFKWLTYEKKIETFARGSGLAFFDRRGWTNTTGELDQASDLRKGAPLHFPVPARELNISMLAEYTHGGTTGDFAAKTMHRKPIRLRINE